MRNTLIAVALFICSVVRSQTVSFQVTDMDNHAIKGVVLTIDRSVSKTTDCNGQACIASTPGVHRIDATNPNMMPYVDSVKFTANDTSMAISMNPRWCIAEFYVSRNGGDVDGYQLECDNVTTQSAGNQTEIELKPGEYTYDIITLVDTNEYSIAVANDTTVYVYLPNIASKNGPAQQPACIVNPKITLGAGNGNTVKVVNMAGQVVDTQVSPQVSMTSNLNPGMYILVIYPADKQQPTLLYKILITK